MKKTIITILKCFLCFAVTLGICFGLLCAAGTIPTEKLQQNLIASSDKFNRHMPHEMTAKDMYNSVADYYADAVLLGVAVNISSDALPLSVIDTKYYDDGYGPAVGIRATLGNYPANVDYTRYWHGSLVLVRPLLSVTDIDGIRTVFAAIVIILLAADLILLFVKKHTAAGVILAVSAVLTHFWFTFSTLEYMIIYIIMLAALPFYVKFRENDDALIIISAAVGTVTAFADFLTTEAMTILVPLLLVFFLRAENGKKADSKASVLLTLRCGLSWFAAYALTFITKWIAASAVTGRSISEIAVSAATERISELPESIDSGFELLFGALGANLSMLSFSQSKINILGIAVWAVIFALVCFFIAVRDNRAHILPKPAIIIIAVLPLLRFCVLMNHSYLHNYFTYRALMASIMAVLGLVWYKEAQKADKKKPKKQKAKA